MIFSLEVPVKMFLIVKLAVADDTLKYLSTTRYAIEMTTSGLMIS